MKFRFLVFSWAFLASSSLHGGSLPDVSGVKAACTGSEKWNYRSTLDQNRREALDSLLQTLNDSPISLEKATAAVAVIRSPLFTKTDVSNALFRDYIEARLLMKLGYVHPAYHRFERILAEGLEKKTVGAVKAAFTAMDCVNQLMQRYPSLRLSNFTELSLETHADVLKLNSPRLDISQLGLTMVRQGIELSNARWTTFGLKLLFKGGAYEDLGQFLAALQESNEPAFRKYGEHFLEKTTPPGLSAKYGPAVKMALAASYSRQGQIDAAMHLIENLSGDSNYYPLALSDYGALQLKKKEEESAASTLLKLQMGKLSNAFVPVSMADLIESFNSLCRFSESRYILKTYEKKYGATETALVQLRDAVKQGKTTYATQLAAFSQALDSGKEATLAKQMIVMEWIRSPRVQAFQKEINLFLDEKILVESLPSQWQQKKAALPPAAADKMSQFLTEANAEAQNSLDFERSKKRLEVELALSSQSMLAELDQLKPRLELLRAEIYRGAGNQVAELNKENEDGVPPRVLASAGDTLKWVTFSLKDSSKLEIWKDELKLSSQINIQDECKKE